MMADDFSGITLNITSESYIHNKPKQPHNVASFKRPTTPKIQKWPKTPPGKSPPVVKQRIVDGKVDQRTRLTKDVPSKALSLHDFKHRINRHDGVISSLFKNNPTIPIVKKKSIKQHKEGLFSDSSFNDLGLHPYMVSNLEERLKMNQVTQVQQQCIPAILSGRDVLIKSQTGTGKTLAYAIPIVESLQAEQPPVSRSDGIYAVILVPTRELALQSFETFKKLVHPFQRIVPGSIMGGEKKKAEKARIRKGINILIATPGRLVDHVQNTTSLDLSFAKWFVMDEADRLLDMGFEKDIATIMNAINERNKARQNILLSATLTEGVERLAGISLCDPLYINIAKHQENVQSDDKATTKDVSGKSDECDKYYTTPNQLKQHFLVVPSKLRLVTLAAFILWRCKIAQRSKIIIFLSSRDSVEFHHLLLDQILNDKKEDNKEVAELLGKRVKVEEEEDKISFYKLHGSMSQEERTHVYQEFCELNSGVLFCTDVAARGLDLPKVKWIVQYNTPETPEDYIHRVGRTARIGKEGQSLLFLTPAEVQYVGVLAKQKISLQELVVSDVLNSLLTYNLSNNNKQKRTHHTWEEAASVLQLRMETFVLSNKDNQQLAKTAYQSFIRAYATYPSFLKHIFHVKNLHLGHVAKSFGLRSTPTSIGNNIHKHRQKRSSESRHKKPSNYMRMNIRQMLVSEHASGIDSPPAKRAKVMAKQKVLKQKIKRC